MAAPAFRVINGKTKRVYFPVAASQALVDGTLVELGSGTLNPSDDNDTQIEGIVRQTVASTDPDYASAKLVPVEVPVERHVIVRHEGTSSFVSTDIGGEFGISDQSTVDHSDTTNKVFKVVRVISASIIEGYLKINGGY